MDSLWLWSVSARKVWGFLSLDRRQESSSFHFKENMWLLNQQAEPSHNAHFNNYQSDKN